jgi:hypothetical protein
MGHPKAKMRKNKSGTITPISEAGVNIQTAGNRFAPAGFGRRHPIAWEKKIDRSGNSRF